MTTLDDLTRKVARDNRVSEFWAALCPFLQGSPDFTEQLAKMLTDAMLAEMVRKASLPAQQTEKKTDDATERLARLLEEMQKLGRPAPLAPIMPLPVPTLPWQPEGPVKPYWQQPFIVPLSNTPQTPALPCTPGVPFSPVLPLVTPFAPYNPYDLRVTC